MALEQSCDFGLNGLRQQRAGAIAQDLRQGIRKTSWLAKRENVSLGHGVSLLQWRSGGVKHPHDTPPHPFTPSPKFDHSSLYCFVSIVFFIAITRSYIVFLQIFAPVNRLYF
jgi:hypothetical protein